MHKILRYQIFKYLMCKQDLALNNLEGLICRKTDPTNQPTSVFIVIFCNLINLKKLDNLRIF